MTKAHLTPLVSKFAPTRFRFDFHLAIKTNSLARYSERTLQPTWEPQHPISIMFQIFSQSIKTTFQLSLTVLIRYRTCVIFRFGG